MDAILFLIGALAVFVALDALALRVGVDTRFDPRDLRSSDNARAI